ncbi:MAG: hypothetical protein II208_00635, partial [Alphaproteobacteria bacterium]|nr:hypothetical protein [Alphaproteobacteria bacterium]
ICAFLSVLFLANNVLAAGYTCQEQKYISCKSGYYLSDWGSDPTGWTADGVMPTAGNSCVSCPAGYTCAGDTAAPVKQVIHCDAGYYIPAGSTTCTACKGASSEAAYYCPGGDFTPTTATSSDRGVYSCPDKTEGERKSGFPASYYSSENLTLVKSWFSVSANTKNKKKTDCRLSYTYTNDRGKFSEDAVNYNESTGKYDNGGGYVYYLVINPGYYGSVKLTSTYCNTTSNKMFYQQALPCPAGKYCTGYTDMPLCSSGSYNDTLGITGSVAAGYWSAGGAKTATPASGTSANCVGSKCGLIAAGYYSRVDGMTTATPVDGTDCSGTYNEFSMGTSTFKNCGVIAGGSYSTGGGTSAIGAGCVGSNTCGTVDAGYYSTGGGTKKNPTAAGNGCISGKSCGMVAAGYYSTGGGTAKDVGCNTKLGFTCGAVAAGYYSTGGGTKKNPTAAGNGCISGKSCGKVGGGRWNNGCGTNANGSVCSTDYLGGLTSGGCFGAAGSTTACPNRCSDLAGTGGAYSQSNEGTGGAAGCFTSGSGMAGYFIAVAGGPATACPQGSYSSYQTLYYGETSSCTVCPAGTTTASDGTHGENSGVCTACGGANVYEWETPEMAKSSSYYVKNLCAVKSCKAGSARGDSTTCSLCPSGHYQSVNGYTGQTCSPAQSGYYAEGMGNKKQTPCPAGTYSLSQSAACAKVPAGYWNNGCGKDANGSVCSTDYSGGVIDAGYYGVAGATSSTGSGAVAAGYYSTGGGTAYKPTAAGNGCVSGKSCGKVAAGYWSTGGATTATPLAGDCEGYVSAELWNSASSPAQNECGGIKGGYYSKGGGVLPAPIGTLSTSDLSFVNSLNQGLTLLRNGCVDGGTNCGIVSAGYYSAGYGTSATGTCVKGGDDCGACGTSKYSGSGATQCSSCPSLSDSNWKYVSSTANTSLSACKQYRVPEGCSAGSIYLTAASATTWGTTKTLYQAASGTSYMSASAGNYVSNATSLSCTPCSAGNYCPGGEGRYRDCDTGTTTESSANVWTSDTGASKRELCYRGVTLKKNGMSGTLALPSSHGCKSISSNSGTNDATVQVYYNTACKLPTTALSGSATGTTYAGTGTWATSANAASGFVSSITLTDTSSTT